MSTETLEAPAEASPGRFTPRRVAVVAGVWVLTTLAVLVLVVYALGPMLAGSDQRAALADLRGQMDRALGASQSLFGAPPPTRPAEFSSPVAVLEIPKFQLQQVVLEGVSSSQTASGPGHVPGTSGLGQPGNAAVVGRHAGYGGPFGALGSLGRGDEIIVATTQGRSVYRVTDVADRALDENADYGRTSDDRLTLVTGTSWWPLASSDATVVTARLEGKPFRPTPQNGRADTQDGRTGDTSAWTGLVLALGGFALAAAGATLLYRRWRPVSTYVVTAPPLLALATMAALSLWRLLPAWA